MSLFIQSNYKTYAIKLVNFQENKIDINLILNFQTIYDEPLNKEDFIKKLTELSQ